MKTKLLLLPTLLMLFVFAAGNIYAQKIDCCEDKSASCCTQKSECCSDAFGKAGGDTNVTALTCVVAGESIAEGQAVKFDYYGKTYNFCCEGCLAKFKKEPFDYLKEEVMCPVMGEPIVKDVYVMHNDTKYYLCCKSCLKKFKNDPEKYIKGTERK